MGSGGPFVVETNDYLQDENFDFCLYQTEIIDNTFFGCDYFIYIAGKPKTNSTTWNKQIYEKGTKQKDRITNPNILDFIIFKPQRVYSYLFEENVFESLDKQFFENEKTEILQTYIYEKTDGTTEEITYYDGYEGMQRWFNNILYVAHYNGTTFKWLPLISE